MRTEISIVALAGALVALPTRDARACGPDFAVELLSDRDQTLLELEEGIFIDEVAHLVPPPAHRYLVLAGEDPAHLRIAGDPEESARYDEGARAFAAGDYAAAERSFQAVLALPAAKRRHRSTWAAYMLGRLRDGEAGIRAYAQVRALVDEGFLDERGLAASSLGQEARLHLDVGDDVTAVQRYAEQAAHGHPDGAMSLLQVVREVVRCDRASRLLAHPVGQRLLAVYLFTRDGELDDAQRERLWQQLGGMDTVAGAEQLAAAAYRAGRWDLARRFADQVPDAALARWVRAKLALRAGDAATARHLLGQVTDQLAAACPPDAWHWENDPPAPVDRARGEAAVLALAADEPMKAMELAWAARASHPYAALHIAERVLSIDELRTFVDALPPDEDDRISRYVSTGVLRDLLGRRLLRAGQFDQAWPYLTRDHRADAILYASAVRRAEAAADPIERARAYYEASMVARQHGLEILGTEHAPDWAIEDGRFDLSEHGITGGWPSQQPSPWISAGEIQRIERYAPAWRRRYHYRYLASELAEKAADALPHQSQAFAAVLCHATRYIFEDDRARVDALWRRYVADGPSVPFSSTFGQSCPEPEFERARRFLPSPLWIRLVRIVGGCLWIAGLMALGRFGTRALQRWHTGEPACRITRRASVWVPRARSRSPSGRRASPCESSRSSR